MFLSTRFPEAKFLGQRMGTRIAKRLSGNVVAADTPPPIAGRQGALWPASSVAGKSFYNLLVAVGPTGVLASAFL